MYNPMAVQHNNRGVDFEEMGDFAGAIREYRAAIAIDPNFIEAINGLGACLARTGRLDEAIECFEKVLKIRPNFQPAKTNLRKATIDQALTRGIALAGSGNLQRAKVVFEDLIRNYPDDPAAYVNLGRVYAEMGERERAISQYEKALQITPNYAQALNNLGFELADMGQEHRAAEYYRKAIIAAPNYADPHNNLGTLLLKQGDIQGAAEHFRAALRIDPTHETARRNLEHVNRMLAEPPPRTRPGETQSAPRSSSCIVLLLTAILLVAGCLLAFSQLHP